MKNLFVLFAVLLFGCASPTESDKMVYAEGPARYDDLDDFADYNLSLAKWEGETVKYAVTHIPEIYEESEYKRLIAEAAAIWTEVIQLPIIETSLTEADIEINTEKIDGLGGTLGRAWFPPNNSSAPYPVPLKLDYFDTATKEGRARYDFLASWSMNWATPLGYGTL